MGDTQELFDFLVHVEPAGLPPLNTAQLAERQQQYIAGVNGVADHIRERFGAAAEILQCRAGLGRILIRASRESMDAILSSSTVQQNGGRIVDCEKTRPNGKPQETAAQ